ncbi:MAG: hypothetical protein ACK542_02950, partial [Burkholderiales bacterium]
AEFIEALQEMKVTPHVAQNKSNRASAVPEEIAATDGNRISQQKRKLIEQGFGWAKFIGPIRQVMVRGIKKVDQVFVLAMFSSLLKQCIWVSNLAGMLAIRRRLAGRGGGQQRYLPV